MGRGRLVPASEPLRHVLEVVPHAQCRGTEDNGVLHIVEHPLQVLRDRKRRSHEPKKGPPSPNPQSLIPNPYSLNPIRMRVLLRADHEVRLVRERHERIGNAVHLRREVRKVVEFTFRHRIVERIAQLMQEVHHRRELGLEVGLRPEEMRFVPLVRLIRLEESVQRIESFRVGWGRAGIRLCFDAK